MKKAFAVALLLVVAVSTMAYAVEPPNQNAWRLYLKASNPDGSYGGALTMATRTDATDGYDAGMDQPMPINIIQPNTAFVASVKGQVLSSDTMSTKAPGNSAYAPSYEKVWDLRVGAFPSYASSTIKLTLNFVSSAAGRPSTNYRYFVRMVDNKHLNDADPLLGNGKIWEIAMPSTYTSGSLWTLELPTRLVSMDTIGVMDGYQMQFVQTIVPEPSSALALGALMTPLLACMRRRRGK